MQRYVRALLIGATLIVGVMALPASTETLRDHLRRYPSINQLLALEEARGELVYPDWFAGTWQVRTTLVDLTAPLGGKVINREAFEASRALKGKPVTLPARFVRNTRGAVVADLRFNGRSIAAAYLGKDNVLNVEVRPDNPNRQLLTLRGDRRGELITLRRRTEQPGQGRFDTAELYQQTFSGGGRIPNLRTIETTTLYKLGTDRRIKAEQLTAVYLDPRDPRYFDARDRPVTLYRYRLEFEPLKQAGTAARTSPAPEERRGARG